MAVLELTWNTCHCDQYVCMLVLGLSYRVVLLNELCGAEAFVRSEYSSSKRQLVCDTPRAEMIVRSHRNRQRHRVEPSHVPYQRTTLHSFFRRLCCYGNNRTWYADVRETEGFEWNEIPDGIHVVLLADVHCLRCARYFEKVSCVLGWLLQLCSESFVLPCLVLRLACLWHFVV